MEFKKILNNNNHGGYRKGAGRPASKDRVNKGHSISMKAYLVELIKNHADVVNLSASQYIRGILKIFYGSSLEKKISNFELTKDMSINCQKSLAKSFTLNISPDEFDELEDHAAAVGMTYQEYVKNCIYLVFDTPLEEKFIKSQKA